MAEYIDRYELLKALSSEGTRRSRNSESPDLLRGLVIAILVAKKEVETADVIPVVRCFECERSELYSDSQSALTCREFGCTVPRDGFCHEGRRNQCLNE
jgi:hypothetical protein